VFFSATAVSFASNGNDFGWDLGLALVTSDIVNDFWTLEFFDVAAFTLFARSGVATLIFGLSEPWEFVFGTCFWSWAGNWNVGDGTIGSTFSSEAIVFSVFPGTVGVWHWVSWKVEFINADNAYRWLGGGWTDGGWSGG